MSIPPNPAYTTTPMYASPAMVPMTSTPYGPSPYTPVMATQAGGYYPPMQMGQPVVVQQPYGVYRRDGCCDCSCCAGILTAFCVWCCCCCNDADECCC